MHLKIASEKIWTRPQGIVGEWTDRGLPAGVLIRTWRPSFARYRRRTFISGYFDRGVVHDDYYDQRWRLGLEVPTVASILAAQGTGVTGAALGYYTFAHYYGPGDLILGSESELSPVSALVNLVNQGRRHTTPVTSLDARVNYKNHYVSIDGLLPRKVGRSLLATATFDENVPTSTLVNLPTPPVNSDGTLNSGALNPPPFCLFNHVYHGRVWYAGDPNHPERAYYSLIDNGEGVGPTSYIETLGREAITGLGSTEDQMVVFCADVSYDIQGYVAGPYPDFNMRRVMPKIGCCSHHGVVNIDGRLYFPSPKDGVVMFDGQPHPVMDDLLDFWVQDYKDNRAAYENSIAEDDRTFKCYRLLIPNQSPAFYYQGYYDQVSESGQLEWEFDSRDRDDYTLARLWTAGGKFPELFVGGADGKVRQENNPDDTTDDGDTRQRLWTVSPKHVFFGNQSGGRLHGRSVKEVTPFISIPGGGPITITAWGGDDPAQAMDALPTWGPHTINIPAKETSKLVKPTKLSGKGVAIEIQKALPPTDAEYRGVSILASPGPAGKR